MALAVLLLSACGPGDPAGTGTPALSTSATPRPTLPPTPTATPEPVGNPSNPFIIGFISEASDELLAPAADETARRISESSEMAVSAQIYDNYPALLADMAAGKIHAAWLPPLTYLYASQKDLAQVVLLTNHFGVYLYGSEFLANVESGFTSFFDPISGLTSAGAAEALAQFADKRPCFVDPQSASGYIVPAGLMAANSIAFQPPVFIQDHPAVVRALYIKGICDFGATFAISGDPRTASAVLGDLPDAMNRVPIIWRSDAIIPNLNFSIISGMGERQRQAVINGLLEIVQTEEGRALLSTAVGNYQIDDLRRVDDPIYDNLRVVMDALKLDPKTMLGK